MQGKLEYVITPSAASARGFDLCIFAYYLYLTTSDSGKERNKIMAKVINNNPISGKTVGIIVGVSIGIIVIIALIASCLVSVPTGHTGILTTFGKVEDTTLEAGMHFKLPWQSVVKMDNRNQKQVLELSCFSSDIQEVSITYSINYQIEKTNAQTIYKSIGVDYYNTVMVPRIQSAVKEYTALYTAETLIEKRETLSEQIYTTLQTELAQYNIVLLATAIEDLDFNDAFTEAVEQKQVAAQKKLQAEIEQQRATMEAEEAAKRAVISANADAETAKIKAESDAAIVKIQADSAEYQGQKEAAINNALASSLTPELIQYYYITYWDGKLPETYVSSEDFLTMLNIQSGKITTEAEDDSSAS